MERIQRVSSSTPSRSCLSVGLLVLFMAVTIILQGSHLASASDLSVDNSCVDRCGLYMGSASCQCDVACAKYGDCCGDFTFVCNATNTPHKPGFVNCTANYGPTFKCYAYQEWLVSGSPQPSYEVWPGCNTGGKGFGYCAPVSSILLNKSCAGFCGTKSPAGCYCDAACLSYGDCCSDYLTSCQAAGAIAAPSYCAIFASPTDPYCDDEPSKCNSGFVSGVSAPECKECSTSPHKWKNCNQY